MGEALLGPVDHVIVFVPDVAAAAAEYTQRLGFRKLHGDDANFTVVAPAEGPWIGLHKSETDRPGEPAIPYFRVKDVRRAMEELKKRGVKVGNFHEVPGGLIATAWDAAGNPLGLYQRMSHQG